jgi:hypothetical protein
MEPKENGSVKEEPRSSLDVEHSGLFMEAQGDPDIIQEFLRQANVPR